MAYSALTTAEIASLKPNSTSLWGKVKGNFENFLTRIADLEAAGSDLPTGVAQAYAGSSAPTGWLLLSGLTIGSGSSGGTARADADTQTLFTLLWNTYSNTELVIQDSGGSNTTRGADASADFAANKRMPLPDMRGRVMVGKDNMGGSTASRITNAGCGIVGTTVGAAGGSQSHTLVLGEIPSHDHGGNTGGASANPTHNLGDIRTSAGGSSTCVDAGIHNIKSETLTITNAHTHTLSSAGGGGAHYNVQPSLIWNMIIKL